MLVNFCIINTQRGQILICGCKVFCLLQQIFACGKVKGNTTKRQKTSVFKYFFCQDKPKMSCIVKSNPLYKNDLFEQRLTRITSHLFYMLYSMLDMDKKFSCNTVYNCIFLSFCWTLNYTTYDVDVLSTKLFFNTFEKTYLLIRYQISQHHHRENWVFWEWR